MLNKVRGIARFFLFVQVAGSFLFNWFRLCLVAFPYIYLTMDSAPHS